MKNSLIEKTKNAIFRKYPNAVIYFVYDYGEILFYANKEQAGDDENLHSGFIRYGRLFDVTDF